MKKSARSVLHIDNINSWRVRQDTIPNPGEHFIVYSASEVYEQLLEGYNKSESVDLFVREEKPARTVRYFGTYTVYDTCSVLSSEGWIAVSTYSRSNSKACSYKLYS